MHLRLTGRGVYAVNGKHKAKVKKKSQPYLISRLYILSSEHSSELNVYIQLPTWHHEKQDTGTSNLTCTKLTPYLKLSLLWLPQSWINTTTLHLHRHGRKGGRQPPPTSSSLTFPTQTSSGPCSSHLQAANTLPRPCIMQYLPDRYGPPTRALSLFILQITARIVSQNLKWIFITLLFETIHTAIWFLPTSPVSCQTICSHLFIYPLAYRRAQPPARFYSLLSTNRFSFGSLIAPRSSIRGSTHRGSPGGKPLAILNLSPVYFSTSQFKHQCLCDAFPDHSF